MGKEGRADSLSSCDDESAVTYGQQLRRVYSIRLGMRLRGGEGVGGPLCRREKSRVRVGVCRQVEKGSEVRDRSDESKPAGS